MSCGLERWPRGLPRKIRLTLLLSLVRMTVKLSWPIDSFTPFEPATKIEALIAFSDGNNLQILKGAPLTITALTVKRTLMRMLQTFQVEDRVLAVAVGPILARSNWSVCLDCRIRLALIPKL